MARMSDKPIRTEDIMARHQADDIEVKSEEQAMVPFFIHENAMMHKDMDNERMHKSNRNMCITFIIIIVIFVTGYTIRMKTWADTVMQMKNAIVEVYNAKGIDPP